MSAASPSFSNKPDHLPIKTSLTLSLLSLAHSSVKKKTVMATTWMQAINGVLYLEPFPLNHSQNTGSRDLFASELSPHQNYYNGGCWSFYIYSIMINLMNATLSYLKTDCLLILFLAWFLPSFSFHHLISLNWKSIIIPQHNSDISSDMLNSSLLDASVFFIRSISCAFNTKVVSKTNSKKFKVKPI